jgi:NAD+ synthase (glutamine-hydrolysing)
MSFRHNRQNTIESILKAKDMGATYLLGPELQISGYGCEDHFFESDTVKHSWQTLQAILDDKELTQDILVDLGMPLYHKNTLYNTRIFCLN